MAFCSGYPHLGADEGLGLLFSGDNGVGKTHLAVAVLRELVETKGARGQFWDFHELIREIKSSYDPETKTTELQVLEPVVEADVLLLDDLGAWKMTDWMNDTLFYILNSRYMAKRPTLITTNYQDVTREEALAADPLRRREFLVERIGQRLRSRLMEMCLVVRLQGSDHRQARQQANQVALRRRSRQPPCREELSAGDEDPLGLYVHDPFLRGEVHVLPLRDRPAASERRAAGALHAGGAERRWRRPRRARPTPCTSAAGRRASWLRSGSPESSESRGSASRSLAGPRSPSRRTRATSTRTATAQLLATRGRPA